MCIKSKFSTTALLSFYTHDIAKLCWNNDRLFLGCRIGSDRTYFSEGQRYPFGKLFSSCSCCSKTTRQTQWRILENTNNLPQPLWYVQQRRSARAHTPSSTRLLDVGAIMRACWKRSWRLKNKRPHGPETIEWLIHVKSGQDRLRCIHFRSGRSLADLCSRQGVSWSFSWAVLRLTG